ncbi:MAG TPA: 2-oxoacid:acceptor oxidoreductase subunit alpha [Aggregatilineales bacterium]|nr:2-oxoacid:acceptor oxidoreductase subunit alpha [Anaerolineales bacterium]HRE46346.1 2-oxoacid:acceptor oxidoreductase subunit alpha [Aggregatilineales bacterium]
MLAQADPHIRGEGVVVNDFAIVVATVNGSGSQTANNTLVRALFKMGIPANGKNLFPSNIYGLPTWYTIRVSEKGYTARREDYHVLAAMNPKTGVDDIAKLAPGGVVFYPDDWKLASKREDITYYTMPVKALVKASEVKSDLKEYVANMVYVGSMAELLGIEVNEIKAALSYFLKGKEKAVNLNFTLVEQAMEHFRATYPNAPKPFIVQRLEGEKNGTAGKIMIEGNSAGALGAVFGGVSVAAWYPITPSTSMIDYLSDYIRDLRATYKTNAEGKKELAEKNCAIVQAEDELAAVGMIIGAGWMGARAMTATSGPGISLMSEFAGLAYFAEIPAVIWDIQRMGPSTGLPTRTSQGDVLKTYFLSHGDTRHVVLLPAGMEECFEFGWRAFDVAEHLQTPVFVLSDLDLGMNLWMSKPFDYPTEDMDRGKLFTFEDMDKNGGKFLRYRDVEGDGIAARSISGKGPAWFARGTGHTEAATYSEDPEVWTKNLQRLERKFDTARKVVPQPVTEMVDGAQIGIIGYGSSDPGIREALDVLTDGGLKADYHRLRALPLGDHTRNFLASHERVYVVENNYLGQMADLLRMEYPEYATRVIAVNMCNGLPLTARWIAGAITEQHESK